MLVNTSPGCIFRLGALTKDNKTEGKKENKDKENDLNDSKLDSSDLSGMLYLLTVRN